MKNFSIRFQLFVIVIVITIFSLWRIYEKVSVLGFSMNPNAKTSVWQVEAKVNFTGEGKPVEVYLTIPRSHQGLKILEEESGATGYGFKVIEKNGVKRAVWTRREAKGHQELFYKILVYDNKYYSGTVSAPEPPEPPAPAWEGSQGSAAQKIIAEAVEKSSNDIGFVGQLIEQINSDTPSPEVKLLLGGKRSNIKRLRTLENLLASHKVPSRLTLGLELKNSKHVRRPARLLEFYTKGKWHVINPKTGAKGIPANFLLFRRGGESLLDVVGGKNSSVSFSIIESVRGSFSLSSSRAKAGKLETFFNFSIYSLPAREQNAFKWFCILPLAILVIVLIRNVIGLRTMGTFTPILISMAFLETKLLPGLLCFTIIVTLGLLVRFYLSKLNLLLVPRISAVVIVVIILMELVSIISYKAGLNYGLRVTYFPLIILAWVIERSSIQWEEDGAHNAMKQIGASLFAAVITYFIISNEYVKHVMFSFSEINLIILGIVMLLGTYSGYRLTELFRFKPLVDNKRC